MSKEINHNHHSENVGALAGKLAGEAVALAYAAGHALTIDKSQMSHKGKPREKGELLHLEVQGPKAGLVPHFRISKEGSIAQFKDCRLKENDKDKSISIEIEPGGSLRQKQALSDLRKSLRANFNISSEHVATTKTRSEIESPTKGQTTVQSSEPPPPPVQREAKASESYYLPRENSYQAASYSPDFSPEKQALSNLSPAFSLNAPLEGATAYDALSAAENARIVAKIAEEMGIDPVMAVACMLVESGGNCKAIGDNGTSFGLFQLHKGGHLDAFHLTPAQAFNPATNARCALSVFKENLSRYANPGQLAAACQRPADPQGYAQKVNASMGEARKLLLC